MRNYIILKMKFDLIQDWLKDEQSFSNEKSKSLEQTNKDSAFWYSGRADTCEKLLEYINELHRTIRPWN